MRLPKWLLLSITVPVLWGFWGALTEIPEKWLKPTFPPTLGYVVWSLTMLPVSVIAFRKINWRLTLTRRSVVYGCAVGFSGAAGQLMLFWVLQQGPAYLIFPIVCLSPAVTIVLSWTLSAGTHVSPCAVRYPAVTARNSSCVSTGAIEQPGSWESLAGRDDRYLFPVGSAGLLHEIVCECNQRGRVVSLHDGDQVSR